MRILFASTRGTGHFNPLVPLIEAAVRGGHEVMVAGPPPLAETVERAGYPFWGGAEPPEDQLGPLWGRVPTVSADEANAIVVGEIFAGLNVHAMLPSLEAACREWQPDVLIREEAEFASAIAAERHGVRHARLGISLRALEELALEIAGPRLDDLRPETAERIRSSPYLTTVPVRLEDPERTQRSVTHRFRDPATSTPAEPRTDGRPLVYVSFGSIAGTMPIAGALYAAVFEAAADLPAQVLLTLGQRDADLEALGPAPPNLRVEAWVNPADVLARANVAVSHGGFGTTLGAVAAGVPLVVVPLFGDQPDSARRVEAVGAGVAVWPQRADESMRSGLDSAALRDAVVAVLDDPAYGRVASVLAAEMAALPPADEALALLMDARRRAKGSQSHARISSTPSTTACGRCRSGISSSFTAPLIPLRTRIVREPPRWPSAMSIPMSSPITATSVVGTPSRTPISSTAARDGLPTTIGRAPVTRAIPAVTIAPRLKMIPFAPQKPRW